MCQTQDGLRLCKTVGKRQKTESRKSVSKSDRASVAIARSNQKLGCVSQDVELPEPNGWTY